MHICWNQLLGHKRKVTKYLSFLTKAHMDMFSRYLSSKVEHITSSLCGYIFLWTAKLHLSMKNNQKQYCPANDKGGLKTLIHSGEKATPPRILHCYKMTATSWPKPPPPPPLSASLWSPSSPAFRSTMIGDVIGTESGDCMGCDDVVERVEVNAKVEGENEVSRSERRGRKREFPPPITLLRETGRMPWSFKREYSDDGRLIIRAERVRRHEYIEAHRENGRLTMRLVHDEDDENVLCEECGYPMNEEELEDDDLQFNQEPEEEKEEEEEEELVKEGSSLESESGRCGISYAGGGGGLVQDSDSFWTGIGDANGYLGRPGSAPLRPMTPVM